MSYGFGAEAVTHESRSWPLDGPVEAMLPAQEVAEMRTSDGKFKFVLADSTDLKQAIYRLRYQVYVDECGFERPEDHPGGFETDEYEAHSIHLAALDQADTVIGTVRMVLHSEKGFPIEHVTPVRFVGEKPTPDRIAEISRLAISRAYRRRIEDGLYGVESYIRKSEGGVLSDTGDGALQNMRKNPVIILGLYQLLYHVSKRLGLTHWYMIAEKKLWYALKRYHFYFHQVGDPVQYHGLRIPYLGIIGEIEERVRRANPDLFNASQVALEEGRGLQLREVRVVVPHEAA